MRSNRKRIEVGHRHVVSTETLEARTLLSTYYFSTSGSDSHTTNSQSTPWATIAKANTLDLNAGDQLLFKGGDTFAGNLSLTAEDAGTATNPVVVGSWSTGRATINAGSSGNGVYVYNAAGIRIQDLVARSNWNATNQTGSDESGVEVRTDLTGGTKLDGITIRNVEAYGFKYSGIEIVANNSSLSGFRNVLIENCVSHDNGDAGILSSGYYNSSKVTYSHENVTVRSSTAYNNRGIKDKGNNSGSGIVLSSVNGATIERSIAYTNGDLNNFGNGGPVGIWFWDVNNGLIQHCESYSNNSGTNDGGGFDFDGGVTNSIAQYNYSHDNKGPGYLVYEFGGRSVTNNIIRYNVTKNDGYGMLISTGSQTVYNNTIYTNKGTGISLWSGTHKIFNNIVVSSGNQLYATTSSASSEINGNAYYKINGGLSIVWGAASGTSSTGSTTYTSLSSFQSATSKEANGFNVDPKLRDAGNGGTIGDANLLGAATAYKLKPDSPLIDAGLNLTASPFNLTVGSRDYYGNSLPQGSGYDIGAHEVQQHTLTNGTFETGSLGTAWTSYNGGTVTSSGQRSGSYAGLIPVGKSDGLYQTVTGLKPNTTYTFRGYVKTGATSTTAYLGVKNHGNAEVSSSTTATGYTLLTATFTTGATNTSAQVYVWTGNTGGVWADDLALVGPTADQVNLAAAFNQVGITTDGTRTTDGGLDGQNNTLSSAALGGASVNWNGVEFALGSTGKNNVVKGGTAVTATLPSGQYSTLNLLATAVGGNRASQTFRVTYSDNTFTDFVRSMSDWFTPQNYAGESVAKASTYRNKGDGTKDSRTFNVYGYTLTLDPAKTVASVTLPASGNVKLLAATLVA